MYKLYLFPRKISGAITDLSVYVYHLLNRERAYISTVQTADGMWLYSSSVFFTNVCLC